MSFKRTYLIFKVLFKFRIRIMKTFKLDSILAMASNIILLLGSILFWLLISESGFDLKGWSYSDILVFIAFSEMFYGFEQNVFASASEFWRVIYMGVLDVQIMRPFDVRLRFLLMNVDYLGLFLSFIKVGIIILVSGSRLSLGKILLAISFIFMACYVLMLIRFMVSYLAFKYGKTEVVTQLCDSITKFNKYPLVIFPVVIRIIMTVALPFYFFSTFPAEYVLGKVTGVNILYMLCALLGNMVLWTVLNNLAWRRGRINYESLNG